MAKKRTIIPPRPRVWWLDDDETFPWEAFYVEAQERWVTGKGGWMWCTKHGTRLLIDLADMPYEHQGGFETICWHCWRDFDYQR